MRKIYTAAAGAVFMLFFSGCVIPMESSRTTHAVNPLSLEDIKTLNKAGVGDDIIISQIKATRTVYRLSAAQIIELKNDGISQKVLDCMINTAAAQASREAATVAPDSYHNGYYYIAPFPVIDFYPPPPFHLRHGHHW